MNIYKRFFIVESGEFFDEVVRLYKINKINDKVWKEATIKFKAEDAYKNSRGEFVGFKFNSKNLPNPDIWKRDKWGVYSPKKSKKEGKALFDELSKIPNRLNYEDAFKIYGLTSGFIGYLELRGDGKIYAEKVGVLFSSEEVHKVVVSFPWADIDPTQLHRHKTLQFVFPNDWVEVKEWEIERLIVGEGK